MRPGVETLRGLSLFATWPATRLAQLNEAGDLQRVGPDEPLFGFGECLQHLHVLISGLVTLLSPSRGTNEIATDVVAPPTPLCLSAALLELPTPLAARTVSATRLVLVPVADLTAILRDDPKLGASFLDCALRNLHRTTAELCNLKVRSSVQRLADFLLSRVIEADTNPARFVLPYEKRFLAAKIGCSQENLSRAFASLRRIGVETRGGVVVIRDTAALRALGGPTAYEGERAQGSEGQETS